MYKLYSKFNPCKKLIFHYIETKYSFYPEIYISSARRKTEVTFSTYDLRPFTFIFPRKVSGIWKSAM